MQLSYMYKDVAHQIQVTWSEEGRSTVFRDIIDQLDSRHKTDFRRHLACAEQLDQLADIIFSHAQTLSSETMTSYDPTLPRVLTGTVNQMESLIYNLPTTGAGGILFVLYGFVLERLTATVGVYLDDNRLKNKERMKLKREEKRFGTRLDIHTSAYRIGGFEEMILELIDASAMLDCLTATQRRRLIQHIAFNESVKEIAQREKVGERRIQKSIIAALDKLRKQAEL